MSVENNMTKEDRAKELEFMHKVIAKAGGFAWIMYMYRLITEEDMTISASR